MIIFMFPGSDKVSKFLLIDNSAMNMMMKKVVMSSLAFLWDKVGAEQWLAKWATCVFNNHPNMPDINIANL